MGTLTIISYLLFYCMYAYFSKIREAYYYDLHYRINHKHKDLHSTYFKERSVFLALFLASMLNDVNWLSILLLIPFSFLAWDFIADGIYFACRNQLNPFVYMEGFKSTESDTSTAITDKKGYTKTYKQRKNLFIFANIFLLGSLIIEIFKNAF